MTAQSADEAGFSLSLSVLMAAKLRVLCLHGYRQNGATFSAKMGSFRKGLKASMEFGLLITMNARLSHELN